MSKPNAVALLLDFENNNKVCFVSTMSRKDFINGMMNFVLDGNVVSPIVVSHYLHEYVKTTAVPHLDFANSMYSITEVFRAKLENGKLFLTSGEIPVILYPEDYKGRVMKCVYHDKPRFVYVRDVDDKHFFVNQIDATQRDEVFRTFFINEVEDIVLYDES